MTVEEFQHKLINLQEDMIRFAGKLTNHKEDAKDLVQDTFLKALRYFSKYQYDSNLKAWIFTIMKNTFINDYRRSANMNMCRVFTNDGYLKEGGKEPASNHPDSLFSTKELETTISQLKDDLKMPFKMYYDGFRYKEIADNLDLKLGTVKSRIFLAKRQLMNQIARY